MSTLPGHAEFLGSESEPNGTLFVLFIPSKDRDGNDLADQQMWASAAGRLLSEIFGGATQMPPAKGMWLNEETGQIITEEIILVHCYARSSHVNDEARARRVGRVPAPDGEGDEPGRSGGGNRRRPPPHPAVHPWVIR